MNRFSPSRHHVRPERRFKESPIHPTFDPFMPGDGSSLVAAVIGDRLGVHLIVNLTLKSLDKGFFGFQDHALVHKPSIRSGSIASDLFFTRRSVPDEQVA